MKILNILFILLLAACGSEESSKKLSDFDLESTQTSSFKCQINGMDQAWQQGFYVAKSLCEQGTLGGVKVNCSLALQRHCMEGIQSYLVNSPCGSRPALNNDVIHRIMCPFNR